MRLRLIVSCVVGLALAAGSASGQTYTWNNTTGNWSVGANWGGTAPTGTNGTDVLQFGSAGLFLAYTATNNVADPFLLNRLHLGGNSEIGGGSSGNVIAGGRLRFTGVNALIDFTSVGNYQLAAPIDLASNLTIRPNSASTSDVYQLTFGSLFGSSNQISGAGTLIMDGTGTSNRVVTFLYGTANSYSGGTQVLGGATLYIQSDAALGTGGVTLTNGTLRSNVAAGVDTTSRAYTLTGENTLAADGFLRFDGPLSGTGSVSTARINFPGGTFRLAGNANTYSGGTTVGDGTHLIALNTAGSATGTGAVTVASGGTLGGTGFVTGPVTVANNGRVNPGDRGGLGSGQGNLTLDGGLDMSGGGVYVWNLGALSTDNPGTNFDVITVRGGNLILDGSSKLTLEFSVFGVTPNTPNAFWNQSREWTIIDIDGLGTNSENTTYTQITNPHWTTGTFSLRPPATQGGDVVLVFTPVPEPSFPLLVTAAVGLVGGLTLRLRRRFSGGRN